MTSSFLPYLYTGVTLPRFQSHNFPFLRDMLNRHERELEIEGAASRSNHTVTPSGPVALLVFRPSSNFSMFALEHTRSAMTLSVWR